jgi:hypothetical protein
MKASDRYLKVVEWSEEDQCYVGSCPGLMIGGVHGDDEAEVYRHPEPSLHDTCAYSVHVPLKPGYLYCVGIEREGVPGIAVPGCPVGIRDSRRRHGWVAASSTWAPWS